MYHTKQAMLKSMTQKELLQRVKDRRRELVAKRQAKRLNKLKRRTDICKQHFTVYGEEMHSEQIRDKGII